MVDEIKIPFPVEGRDDSIVADSQPRNTTIEAYNVRAINERSGRLGGARRTGMRAFCSESVGFTGGRGAASVIADLQHLHWSANSDPTERWSATGPSGGNAYSVREDDARNSFTLEGGTHVVVRNSAGDEQARILLPSDDNNAVFRALAVDGPSQRFYVATSAGDSQSSARLLAYALDSFKGWTLQYRFETGLFIEKLELDGAELVAIANDDDTGRSYAIGYGNVGTLPTEDWRTQVTYPATCFDIAPNDGDIAVASPTNATRAQDPTRPGDPQVLDHAFRAWWIDETSNYASRRWCLFDAAEIDGSDGDSVNEWADIYGSPRVFRFEQETVDQHGTNVTVKVIAPATNFADGDLVTITGPGGTLQEVYTFRNAPSAARDVLIGGSLSSTWSNFRDTINNGGSDTSTYTVQDTEVSALVYSSNGKVRCLPAYEAVDIALTTSNVQLVWHYSGSADFYNGSLFRLEPSRSISTTAPKLKKKGLAGRPCVAFDGNSNKLVTSLNTTKWPASKDSQFTLFPSYGINNAESSSANFVTFVVMRQGSQMLRACAVAQESRTELDAKWVRRIISNIDPNKDLADGYVGVTEYDNGVAGYVHAADIASATDSSGFVLVTIVSNPNSTGGLYEIYINGTAAPNSTAATTGSACANDARNVRTTLGHYGQAIETEAFWRGEIYMMLTLHAESGEAITQAERFRIEGAICWYFGEQRVLPGSHPYSAVPVPPTGFFAYDWNRARQALSYAPIVTKLDGKTKKIAWMAGSDTSTPSTTGGLGSGLKWLSTGDLVSVGVPVVWSGTGHDTSSIKLIKDLGTGWTVGWGVTLGSSSDETFTYHRLELARDDWDNVYIPFQCDGYQDPHPLFLVVDVDGNIISSPTANSEQAAFSCFIPPSQTKYDDDTIERAESILVAQRREKTAEISMSGLPTDGDTIEVTDGTTLERWTFVSVLAAAFDVAIGASVNETLENLQAAIMAGAGSGTAYEASTTRSTLISALAPATQRMVIVARDPENEITTATSSTVVVFDPEAGSELELSTPNEACLELVSPSLTGESGRERIQIQVVDGDVWKYGEDYSQIAVGGAAALDATARYVHSVVQYGRVFTTDGKSSVYYDSATDSVQTYRATNGGEVPAHAQMFELFRSRILAMGMAGQAYSIKGSRVDDAFDWDRTGGGVIDGTQAFDTLVSIAGSAPDMVNGFAPLGDDLAIVFGDRSLTLLRGDPAPGANGQFDDIPSGGIGGSFGRAWCRGPSGNLFYWGTDGDLKVIQAGGVPDSVTGAKFRRTFQGIDLSKFYMRMAWNSRFSGLDIIACPYGGIDEPSRAFRWESATNAAWEDIREHDELTFTDLIIADGDNVADRSTLFCCADGKVRTWSELSETDDGFDFEGMVVLGPLSVDDPRFETNLTQLQVLLDRQSADAFVEVWTSDTPSTKGRMRQRFRVRPGLSATLPARVAAPYVFIVVRGKSAWAYQIASALVFPGARRRRTAIL